jgi:hypothetical protein
MRFQAYSGLARSIADAVHNWNFEGARRSEETRLYLWRKWHVFDYDRSRADTSRAAVGRRLSGYGAPAVLPE